MGAETLVKPSLWVETFEYFLQVNQQQGYVSIHRYLWVGKIFFF
jgi:hypothetical protein